MTTAQEIIRCALDDLVAWVKRRVGMDAVRVTVPSGTEKAQTRTVHRVGLPWGGLGLFVNVGYQQALIEQGCDDFIAGESDNYGFRFAQEVGIPMIETSHEVSENPGLQAEAFPDVAFEFYETPLVWHIV